MRQAIEFDGLYYAFIVSNHEKTVFETGVTGAIDMWLERQAPNARCSWLLYWECFSSSSRAVMRSEELSDLSTREKKRLIASINPDFKFFKISYGMGVMDEVGKGL